MFATKLVSFSEKFDAKLLKSSRRLATSWTQSFEFCSILFWMIAPQFCKCKVLCGGEDPFCSTIRNSTRMEETLCNPFCFLHLVFSPQPTRLFLLIELPCYGHACLFSLVDRSMKISSSFCWLWNPHHRLSLHPMKSVVSLGVHFYVSTGNVWEALDPIFHKRDKGTFCPTCASHYHLHKF